MKQKMNMFYRKQKGTAIIVCLMLLTIATLIGVNAVSSTVLEEKMAGNIRNKHMSFQSAEAGLRQAELAAASLTDVTAFDGSNGLYPGSNPGDSQGVLGALADYPVWLDDVNTNWVNGTAPTGIPNAPQYIIEDYSESPRDQTCQFIKPIPPGCKLKVYRITVQAEGLNSNSVSMLQSTYKRL